MSGGGGDSLGEVVDAVAEVGADLGEEVGVEGDAFGFHLDEDGEEGGFDGLVDFGELVFFKEGGEVTGELEGDVGVFGCVLGEGFEGDSLHVDFVGGFGFGCAFFGGLFFFFRISEGEEVVLVVVGLFLF